MVTSAGAYELRFAFRIAVDSGRGRMDCVELQESLAEVEDGSGVEQSTHLKICPACSELVKELSLIVATVSELRAADEPSPMVWNSIEIALRQEGLIRPQHTNRRPPVPSF